MDPMRALASLEFVSARGLETSDHGPKILANQVGKQSNKVYYVIDKLIELQQLFKTLSCF